MELTTQASGDPDFGIALNGGGSRALCCSWGYLRALHHMGILNKAAYISGVSGSGWGLVHLSYSPVPLDEVLTMQRLPSPPESIPDYKADGQVRADLDVMPWGRLGASSWVGVGDASFLNLGRLVNVIDGFLLKVLPPYNFWTWMIGKIFLEPNGIDPSKVTASDEAAVKRAMAADARLKADDFILKRPELTPTPLIAITLAGPAWPRLFQHTTRVQAAHWATTGDDDTQELYRDAVKHRDENGGATLVSFSISPDEITCPYDGPPMETSAFACHIPTPPLTVGKGSVGVTDFIQSRLGKCWPRAFGPNKCLGPQVLSVGDVAGTTSSAVGDLVQGESRKGNLCCQVLTERPIDLLAEHVFLQGYRASPTFNGQDAQELEFFDGGLHECSGVTGLLQKKVTKRITIKLVTSSQQPLSPSPRTEWFTPSTRMRHAPLRPGCGMHPFDPDAACTPLIRMRHAPL